MEGGYPQNVIKNTLSEVKFQERTQALLQRNKTKKRILRFVTQYHTAVPSLKDFLTRKLYLIQQQPLLNQLFKESPTISCRRRRSVKDILARAKLSERRENQTWSRVGVSTHLKAHWNILQSRIETCSMSSYKMAPFFLKMGSLGIWCILIPGVYLVFW